MGLHSCQRAEGVFLVHYAGMSDLDSMARGAGRDVTLLRALAWMTMGSLLLSAMNAFMRLMTLQMDSMQAQFLRYVFAVIVMMPVMVPSALRHGWIIYRPKNIPGQFWRGAVHAAALGVFFMALPHLPLADTTALSFTTPLWVMIGAVIFLRERVSGGQWLAAAVGFSGTLVVVWPQLGAGPGSPGWSLVMLLACPLFAASILTKALTRQDSPAVITAWQAITVTLFSAPLALMVWEPPTARQWFTLLLCGVLGSSAHYCMTKALSLAKASTMQTVRFLDLVWASFFGALLFAQWPTFNAWVGGLIIVASTAWIAHRESRRRR
jgi:drug/metabolite transporter (DMT)-like permease